MHFSCNVPVINMDTYRLYTMLLLQAKCFSTKLRTTTIVMYAICYLLNVEYKLITNSTVTNSTTPTTSSPAPTTPLVMQCYSCHYHYSSHRGGQGPRACLDPFQPPGQVVVGDVPQDNMEADVVDCPRGQCWVSGKGL